MAAHLKRELDTHVANMWPPTENLWTPITRVVDGRKMDAHTRVDVPAQYARPHALNFIRLFNNHVC